eukprot:7376392-Pyramimonas_sp.AAC.1
MLPRPRGRAGSRIHRSAGGSRPLGARLRGGVSAPTASSKRLPASVIECFPLRAPAVQAGPSPLCSSRFPYSTFLPASSEQPVPNGR